MSTIPRIAMKWCRLYAEFALDPKVQSMSEAMQRRLCMLFCLQTAEMLAGIDDAELAATLRISAAELARTKAMFLKKGFIGDDWTLTNWHKRQYRSDSSTDRTRRHKERMKAERSAKGAGTFPERPGNGPEAEAEADPDSEADPDAALRQQQSERESENETMPLLLPYPTDEDLLTIRHGRHRHDAADAERLWLEIWWAYRREQLCRDWYEVQETHSIATWRAAFAEARRRGKRFSSVAYVEKIGHDFDVQGHKRDRSPVVEPFVVDTAAEHQMNLEIARRKFGTGGEMSDARS